MSEGSKVRSRDWGDIIPPAVWLPAIRTGTGTDAFTETLVDALKRRGLQAEISWLPPRAEVAPWTVPVPQAPQWANIAHVNTWLPKRFIPGRLPIVATLHHCVQDEALTPYKSWGQKLYHRLWVTPMERRVFARAETVAAVSRYSAECVKRIFGLTDVHVIYNGVSPSFLKSVERVEAHRPFRLLFVGSWSRRKGVDLLPAIMERLGPEYTLHCTGTFNRSQLKAGPPDNMLELGRIADTNGMIGLYEQSDALLFPTRLEGFGLVAAEAQARGLPVVATRCSSLPEVIEDGVTGLLCPMDDVEAFTKAIRRLASDADLWRAMSRGASRRIARCFNVEQMVDGYLGLYQRILHKGGAIHSPVLDPSRHLR